MWDHLPVGAFTDATWRDEVPAMWHHPKNLLDWQATAAVRKIDQDLVGLCEDDPAMYYDGDFNELLERRQALVERGKNGPVA